MPPLIDFNEYLVRWSFGSTDFIAIMDHDNAVNMAMEVGVDDDDITVLHKGQDVTAAFAQELAHKWATPESIHMLTLHKFVTKHAPQLCDDLIAEIDEWIEHEAIEAERIRENDQHQVAINMIGVGDAS